MTSAAHDGSRLCRTSLFVLIISGIIWLGAVNARAFIADDILIRGTVEINQSLSPDTVREAFRLIAVSSIVIIASYLVTLAASVVYLTTSPLRMKEHGWLLMSAILFYLFVPVEIYTMTLDWKMISLEFSSAIDTTVFYELFVARVKALAGVPIIAGLCYYTIIALAVFQPLKRGFASAHET